MNNLLLMKQLKFGGAAVETVVVYNSSGGDLVEGDVVIVDTTNSTATMTAVTTTTSQDDLLVFGILFEAIATGQYGRCLVKGLTAKLKVNGTTDIAAGAHLSCYSEAGIAAVATGGKGGAFAIALEAYAGSVLTAGRAPIVIPIPMSIADYHIGVYYTLSTTFTAFTVSACIGFEYQSNLQ